MANFTAVVGRRGYETELALHLAANVTPIAVADTEQEARILGIRALAEDVDSTFAQLNDYVSVYSVDTFSQADGGVVVGWEVEAEGVPEKDENGLYDWEYLELDESL